MTHNWRKGLYMKIELEGGAICLMEATQIIPKGSNILTPPEPLEYHNGKSFDSSGRTVGKKITPPLSRSYWEEIEDLGKDAAKSSVHIRRYLAKYERFLSPHGDMGELA